MSNEKKLKLTAENVYNIFCDCLLKNEELKDQQPICDFTIGEGVLRNFAFNTERLKEHSDEIDELLSQLPDISTPQSFLALCVDKDEEQWGEHMNMEQLVSLGIACGSLSYVFPKEYWSMLPGRMPLITATENFLNKENTQHTRNVR